MQTLLMLFYEFCKIGAFAVGGGLATMPFLYALTDKYDWFTKTQLIDMVAISESTPGPIGINMATFAGFQASGIVGAIIASVSMILPSLVIIISIARVLDKFKGNKYVNAAFYGLRAAVAALICSAAWDIITISMLNMEAGLANLIGLVNWKAIVLFAIIYFLLEKYKKHPVVYIAMAAVVGIVIQM